MPCSLLIDFKMAGHVLFLAFGSNLGDREKNIYGAYDKIEKRIGQIVSKSAFYTTTPVGFSSENLFFNSVCEVATNMDVHEIFETLKKIEMELGRSSKSCGRVYADRPIDIDILMYDDDVIDEPSLTIPHPRFHLRKFVLEPFAEIAPDIIHPILHKTVGELNKEAG